MCLQTSGGSLKRGVHSVPGSEVQDAWQVARTLVRKRENPNGGSGGVWLLYNTDAQGQGAWAMRGHGRSSVWRRAGLHWLGTQEV